MANSSMFSLPSMTAPASYSRATAGRVKDGMIALENLRAAGGLDALGREHILQRDRDAQQRTLIAGRPRLVSRFGLLAREFSQ